MSRALDDHEATLLAPGSAPRGFEARRVLGAVKQALLGTEGPARIDRYEVRGRIGQGAMGIVYRAHDPELGRDVAVKLVRPAAFGGVDPSRHARRLLREAQTIARFSHPNVVAVYDAGRVDDDVFVVMELVAGPSLAEMLQEGPLPWRDVLALGLGAARGLAAAHARGIVHRDVKPSNIVVAPGGVAKLLDFGLAAPDGEDRDTAHAHSGVDSTTSEGVVVGTPVYMPPEQFTGRSDARSDQYALCLTLYEAVTGQKPFRGASVLDLWQKKSRATLPRPAGIPTALWAAIERGASPEPEDRFAAVDDLVAALERARAERRSRPVIAGVSVLAAALIAYVATASREPACASVSAEAESVWNAQRRDALHAHVLGSGLADAEPIARWVTDRIDNHVLAWTRQRARECHAGRVEEPSPCLRRLQTELDATATVLGELAGDEIEHAPDMLEAIAPPHVCAGDPGEEPPSSAARDQLERQLARVKSLVAAQRTAEAIATGEALRADAQEAGFADLADRSRVSIAIAKMMAGDAQAEIAELEAVHESATARGDFRLAAEAAVEIVHAGLSHGGAPEEVQRWAEHAKVAVARAGELPRTQAQLESALAKLDWNEGRLTSARERLERAVDHWQVVVPEGSVNSSFAMTGLGLVLSDLGEAELARDTQVEAVRMLDAASPPGLWHVYAQNNLSLATAHAGEPDEAAGVARDALALAMDDLGPSHFATFLVLGNLGDALRRSGRCDDALVVLEGPLRTELPEELREHPIVAGALQVQAGCLLDLGRPAEALPVLERSAEIFASVDEPLRLAENRMVLSRALWDSGRDPARAVALAEEARATFAGVSEHRLAWAESWLEQRPPGDPPLR